MGKLAFIYPGQGAQKVGMGKDFYEKSESARQIYDLAEEALDFSVKQICFEENEKINNTAYTQAALVTTCLAMTAELLTYGIVPQGAAGLSLGEYAAICAAEGMSVKDAILLVRKRGILMNEAVPEGEGAMAAVLGLEKEQVEAGIAGIDGVSIANYNCPGQIVITGSKEAVLLAEEPLKAQGAKRVMQLKVSGPFHSPYLKEAAKKLSKELDQVELKPLRFPYVTNVTAEYVTDIADTKELLTEQICSSVRWEQSMRRMIADGFTTFVEIGPGKTLSGFMKKIDKTVTMYHVSQYEDVAQVAAALKEAE